MKGFLKSAVAGLSAILTYKVIKYLERKCEVKDLENCFLGGAIKLGEDPDAKDGLEGTLYGEAREAYCKLKYKHGYTAQRFTELVRSASASEKELGPVSGTLGLE